MLSGVRRSLAIAFLITIGAFVAAFPASSADLPQVPFTDLGTLPNDTYSGANDINGAGQIVGYSAGAGPDSPHAFLWDNGTMTDLGTIGGVAGQSVAFGINEAGQVVGQSYTVPSGADHGFLWENGAMTDLGTIGGSIGGARAVNDAGQIAGMGPHAMLWANSTMTDLGGLWAFGINNAGQIVGSASVRLGHEPPQEHAVLWTTPFPIPPYMMTRLESAGQALSFGMAINSAGQIVGYHTDGDWCDSRALLWENGTVTDLGLSFDCASAPDINAAGQVVGTGTHRYESDRGFLWNQSGATELGTLGGTNSAAFGINDAGQIVGWSNTAGGGTHAFLLQNGSMADLGTLGGPPSEARAINNAGVIVGRSTAASGVFHAVLWENDTITDLGTLSGDA